MFLTCRDPDKDHYPVVKFSGGKTGVENSDYELYATNRATATQPTDEDIVYEQVH